MRMHTITLAQHTPKPSPTIIHTYIHTHTSLIQTINMSTTTHTTTLQKKGRKQERKTFHEMEKGDIGIHEKSTETRPISQTQQPHSTIVTSAPTSPFQHKSHSTTTFHIQNKICMLLSNHSTPIPNRKVTILTPTKSQSKYSRIII